MENCNIAGVGEMLEQVAPAEVVGAPFLETFKDRLDGAVSNRIYWKVSLPNVGALT